MIKKLLYILIIFVMVPIFSYAAPIISTFSGSFSDKETAAIAGSGFGTKSSAKPFRWDNFEGKTAGQNVGALSTSGAAQSSDTGSWSVSSAAPPKYSTAQLRTNSSMAVYHDYNPSSRSNWNSYYSKTFAADNTKFVYITWWSYHTNVAVGADNNWKPMRAYGNTGLLPQFALTFQNSSWTTFGIMNTSGSFTNMQELTWSTAWPNNRWVRVEFIGYLGTANNSDGYQRYFLHTNPGTTAITDSGIANSGSPNITNISQGFSVVIPEEYMKEGNGWEADVYTDDIYIDTTQARVEIGDKSTWSACTHREIQLPTAWSANSVTVTVNRGSFNSGETAYLYVVDADGNVNAQGYPIVIGGGAGSAPAAPVPPTGLKIIGN
jgi:hypothetical protein